jgi:hypothetical protein
MTTTWAFDGWITGLGTTEGTRIVVGRWARSPWGSFADVMVERSDGRRLLLAPNRVVADFVADTYGFDEALVVPMRLAVDPIRRRWAVGAGPLDVSFGIGAPTGLGRLLAAVPRTLTRSRAFAVVADPVARRVEPGVRTRGTAGRGRSEWYCASAQHDVEDVDARWDGEHLGRLTDVAPPVRFGFSSTPRRPAVTTVRSVIRG